MQRPLLLAALLTLPSSAAAQVSLVAHYELNETAGTMCFDTSGQGHHGTYMGVTTLGQAGAAAGSGTAVDFDGATGYVEIPGSAAFDALLSDFSVAAWIQADVLQLQRVFSNDRPSFTPGNTGSWSFGTIPNGLRFTTLWVQDYNQAAVMGAQQWHHIAVAFDAAFTATFYLDGVQVGQVFGNAPSNPPALTNRYLIGVLDPTGGTPSEWFNGRIDDVQVYSGALSPADVQFLHANPGTAIGGGGIGTAYCTPVPNSTGTSAEMSATGSAVATTNDLTLECSSMPNNSFGFFLTSRTQGAIQQPGGSQGVLCVSGAIGRYVGPGQIKNSGATGAISLQVDLTRHPQPSGLVQVLAGDTWNFTAWYRDVVGGTVTSNFANGLSVVFQ
jgi:hypothetical protein